MIKGDYREKERITKSGKKVIDRVVVSTTGVEYAIGKHLGDGGFGTAYIAHRLKDGMKCVFKEYRRQNEVEKAAAQKKIRGNICNLMRNPIMSEDGRTPLKSFIGPMDTDSLVLLPASDGWGYVMEMVEMDSFHSVLKLWNKDLYPDADILCKACAEIARLFRRVHKSGYCYKDLSEGNIYINNKTGEVRIIDCDNIGVQSDRTVDGTPGYMAPEIYETHAPDAYSDPYSMAVLFYRLLVGGYPLDGKKTVDYILKNGTYIGKAAPVIYGSDALFAFDPNDHSNSIHSLKDPVNPHLYAIQEKRWQRLPQAIKDGFIRTFSIGLKKENRYKRTTDKEWIDIFDEVRANELVRCPKCHRVSFLSPTGKSECMFCGKKLAQEKHTVPLRKPSPAHSPVPQPAPAAGRQLTAVKLRMHRDIAPTHGTITAARGQTFPGPQIYPDLNDGWLKIVRNQKRNILAAENHSQDVWTIKANGREAALAPGGRVVLSRGMIIIVRRRKLEFRVEDLF